jgi:hypothetical protein
VINEALRSAGSRPDPKSVIGPRDGALDPPVEGDGGRLRSERGESASAVPGCAHAVYLPFVQLHDRNEELPSTRCRGSLKPSMHAR